MNDSKDENELQMETIKPPTLELTPALVRSLEKFLNRTELKGHEVKEFNQVMIAISSALRNKK